MKQYIDKSVIVAEIERLKECNRKICGGDFDFLKKTYPPAKLRKLLKEDVDADQIKV